MSEELTHKEYLSLKKVLHHLEQGQHHEKQAEKHLAQEKYHLEQAVKLLHELGVND